MDYSQAAGLVADSLPARRYSAPWCLIRLEGPDAADFLQRMCSQDVAGMATGAAAPAAFLNGKGRLLHTCLIGCLAPGRFGLAVHADQAEGLFEHLERFHFSEQMELSRAGQLDCVETLRVGQAEQGAAEADGGLQITWTRRGLTQELQFGAPPEGERAAQAFAALRILRGDPLVGVDTEDSTIVLEAKLEDHIHFDKGCYTGQEIVARIRTYGHTNRSLCLLHIAGEGEIARETALVTADDGEAVGRVMSAAALPGGGARLALGILPNVLADGDEALALSEVGGAAVAVVPWPAS